MNTWLNCDKCGLPVPPHEDASKIDAILSKNPTNILTLPARHLLVIVDKQGAVYCDGSPSRAQYLKGEPRDTRPGAVYEESLQRRVRAAFERMRKSAK